METKNCKNCAKDFVVDVDDFSFYTKMNVPAPTWCPECRLVRRLSFRNERYLYRNKCGLCMKDTLSVYGPHVKRKIFCPACWWSDNWDPSESGVDYDFSKPFFQQLKELAENAPVQSLFLHYQTIVNSDYNNLAGYLKECYMVYHADHNERCMYASGLKVCNDSNDVLMLQKSDLCYESVNVTKGYKNFYSVDCEECSDVYFCKNCMNCTDCIGCTNLRNQKYCIENVQYTKEEYDAKKAELDFTNFQNVRNYKPTAYGNWLKYPVKYMHSRQNINSTGDYVFNSRNTLDSFEMMGAEDCRYCQFASTKTSKDCYDYTEYGENVEMVYETLLLGDGGANVRFTAQAVSNVRDLEYCYGIANASYLFGCIGMRAKQYCILNKQYTKEEYEELVPKIRKHMDDMPYVDAHGREYKYGEFFPLELSSFNYNESTAQEFFPINENVARGKGYAWKNVEEKNYVPTKSWKDLPNTLAETDDSITGEIILCEDWDTDQNMAMNHNCTKAYKILPQELIFYKRMNIPIPRKCPNGRHNDRVKFRNSISLHDRSCMCELANHDHQGKCAEEFKTSYSPEGKEIVYCEKCYQQEVF